MLLIMTCPSERNVGISILGMLFGYGFRREGSPEHCMPPPRFGRLLIFLLVTAIEVVGTFKVTEGNR